MASKIIFVLMTMVILNIALLTFSCTEWNGETGECLDMEEGSEGHNSSIFKIMKNPETVGSGFWETLFGGGWGLLAAIGSITIATVLIGTTIFGKNIETTIYIAIALGLATSVYPAVRLFQMINGATFIGDTMTRLIIAVLTASAIFLTVMMTIVDWGRGRE